MKYVFIIAFILCANLSLGQEKLYQSNSLKINIIASTANGNVSQELKIPLVSKDSLPNIKEEYWDTSVFNPYKEALVKFPVQLKFDDSVFISPISRKKVITSRYGWRRGRPHKGIDIDLITGDSVVTMLDGVVRFARYSAGHGKTVIVRHYNGLETVYAHLSKIGVKANDTVSKGGYIGKGGNTGRSRGSHLHLVTSYKGNYIHPEYLFDFSEENKIKSSEIWITRKHTNPQLHSAYRISKFDLLDNEDLAMANLMPKTTYYTVKPGDTLSRISARNNVSIAALCKSNNLNRNSIIRIGQKLIVEHF